MNSADVCYLSISKCIDRVKIQLLGMTEFFLILETKGMGKYQFNSDFKIKRLMF